MTNITTIIGMGVDFSGSRLSDQYMTSNGGVKYRYIDDCNLFIREQKEIIGQALIKRILFDDVLEEESWYDLANITELGHNKYRPRNATALYDAINILIKKMNRKGETMLLEDPNRIIKYFLYINTDGLDNRSINATADYINKEITKCRRNGWLCVYQGQGLEDVQNQAIRMGFNPNLAVTVPANAPMHARDQLTRGITTQAAQYRSATISSSQASIDPIFRKKMANLRVSEPRAKTS